MIDISLWGGMDWIEVTRGMDWIEVTQGRDRWLALCKCVNEPSGSIKCREFLDQLRTG